MQRIILFTLLPTFSLLGGGRLWPPACSLHLIVDVVLCIGLFILQALA